MELNQMPAYVRKAYARLTGGALLVRTSSDCEEALTRGGGFLYSTEPGGRKFPTASGKALVEGGLVSPRGDGLLPETSQTFVAGAVTMPTVLRRSGPDMLQRDGTY